MADLTAAKDKKLAYTFAKQHGVVLTDLSQDKAEISYRPPLNPLTLMELRNFFQRPIHLISVDPETFSQLLSKYYQGDNSTAQQVVEDLGEELNLGDLMQELPKTADLLEMQDDAPIIRLLNALLAQAIKEKASDIHIETFENQVTIRYRVDGILHEVLSPPRAIAPLLISRVKVMAKLDIAEKRLPQDGRIAIRIGGRPLDVRVSTIPSSHGERVVMRLLDKQAARLDMSVLGMAPETLTRMQQLIDKPHGIILVTGPTGSGKTTTLYAALTTLNQTTRNVMTVEDPIEYDLPGIAQTQVNPKVEMTFARGLRAILRQDPDVVMVGEIRDRETAEIAVQASLTGHLVLSTLHTNTAIGAITRLRDMGVESFLLSSSLIGVLAQRLVRLLCNACKQPHIATPSECQILGVSTDNPPTIYEPQGCPTCRNIGYSGRTGIYELILIDQNLSKMIHENASEQQLSAYARKVAPSIRQDGFRRVLAGATSLEEILRVTNEE
ncbi:MAG: type II secretion system ATPase GspE [Coxiellaceae bacterium]|nr:MAG: type II secretion system ATPase GspE [Coxiellaceae bacterium]